MHKRECNTAVFSDFNFMAGVDGLNDCASPVDNGVNYAIINKAANKGFILIFLIFIRSLP